MFGRNKISQEELERLRGLEREDGLLFARMEENRDMFDASVAELAESYRQMKADASQVLEKIRNASLLAEENVRLEEELVCSMNDCCGRLEISESNQAQLLEQLHQIAEDVTRLVDENKHFTSPSKYLSELSAGVRARNQGYLQRVEAMTDCGKQIGVLALNAAVEAGQMGDSGKRFVEAAEKIRSVAQSYDSSAEELKQELEQSNRNVEKLEEQVKHLVRLLKDNNVSTTRLMRFCGEVLQEAERNRTDAFSKELASLRAQVTVLKNADEEIIKSEERNRMQVEDLIAEFEAQQAGQREVCELVEPVFERAGARKGQEGH